MIGTSSNGLGLSDLSDSWTLSLSSGIDNEGGLSSVFLAQKVKVNSLKVAVEEIITLRRLGDQNLYPLVPFSYPIKMACFVYPL